MAAKRRKRTEISITEEWKLVSDANSWRLHVRQDGEWAFTGLHFQGLGHALVYIHRRLMLTDGERMTIEQAMEKAAELTERLLDSVEVSNVSD